jgi:hypothetical protein
MSKDPDLENLKAFWKTTIEADTTVLSRLPKQPPRPSISPDLEVPLFEGVNCEFVFVDDGCDDRIVEDYEPLWGVFED